MSHRRARIAIALTALASAASAVPADAAPKRIVALTPFTANTLAELGIRPVAIGQTLGGSDRVDPRLRGVPVLKLSHPGGPNIEELAQRNPQLVLSSPTWRRGHGAIRRLKIRVAESEPTSVGAASSETIRIGKLVGRERAARSLARRIRRDVQRARKGIRRRPRVLVILAVGRSPFAMLANSWGGDLVRKAGGRLLTSGLRAPGGYARISNETVVRRNPDIIIAVPHGNPSGIPRLARYLKTNPAWRSTRAARRGRIYVSTGNSLLQPWTDVGRTIRDVRRLYLRN